MELLLAIKKLYTYAYDNKLIESMKTLEEIEKVAEECYHGKFSNIENLIPSLTNIDVYKEIAEKVKEIKNIVKKDK